MSPLPLPREGIETLIGCAIHVYPSEVSFTTSPRGDWNPCNICITPMIPGNACLLYHFPERGLKLFVQFRWAEQPVLHVSFTTSPRGDWNKGELRESIGSATSLLYHFPERGLKQSNWLNQMVFNFLRGLLYHFPERGLKQKCRIGIG